MIIMSATSSLLHPCRASSAKIHNQCALCACASVNSCKHWSTFRCGCGHGLRQVLSADKRVSTTCGVVACRPPRRSLRYSCSQTTAWPKAHPAWLRALLHDRDIPLIPETSAECGKTTEARGFGHPAFTYACETLSTSCSGFGLQREAVYRLSHDVR